MTLRMKLLVKSVCMCLRDMWRKSEEINGDRDKKNWDLYYTTNIIDVVEEGQWMATGIQWKITNFYFKRTEK